MKDTVKFLSGPESTVRDLERLAAFLKDLQGTDTTADEIHERAESAGLSDLVKPLLANRPTRMEFGSVDSPASCYRQPLGYAEERR